MAHPEATNVRRLARQQTSGQSPRKVTPATRKQMPQVTNSSCLCCSCTGCCTCVQHNHNNISSSNSKTSKRTSRKLVSNHNKNIGQPKQTFSSSSSSSLLSTTMARKTPRHSDKQGNNRRENYTRHSSALEKVPRSKEEGFDDCAKCLLIARFTSTQARLTAQRQASETKSSADKSRKKRVANSEVSSLTASSLGGNNDEDSTGGGNGAGDDSSSNWSLSSCSDEDNEAQIITDNNNKSNTTSQRLRSTTPPFSSTDQNHRSKRRQAPLPPSTTATAATTTTTTTPFNNTDPSNNNNYKRRTTTRCDRSNGPEAGVRPKTRPNEASSVDSGNTSETSRDCDETAPPTASSKEKIGEDDQVKPETRVNLLAEAEINSIEHSLKSLKSSTYVCGCLANLYLTNTCLANNGRHSRPTSWQLSRTGVPVLTFDSGLTRNRDKRRLCINLAERGSGFILWSDVIDHLSNYRAYSTQVDDESARPASRAAAPPTTCDTFHVMYLSSNHRLMVGLSFDDAHCARLFLRQVELITADPANISLTGPKRPLARRTLASMIRLRQLLVAKGANKQHKTTLPTQEDGLVVVASSMSCLNTTTTTTTTTTTDINDVIVNDRSRSIAKLTNPTNDGWSTLKRVMRFGQRRANLMAASFDSSADQLRRAAIATPWLRPRPLASLAAAGRNFKRLPRKCDISAPCLFEHVTRVDSLTFERLYSCSLVAAKESAAAAADEVVQLVISQSLSNLESANTEEAAPPMISTKTNCIDRRRSSPIVTATSRQSKENNDRSAPSSCYSSASISPASSDESGDLRVMTPSNIVRAAPPVPPLRRVQLSGASTKRPDSDDRKEESREPQQGEKVKAIIRELQSQASSDLVDAKRLLMADIAAQAAARLSRSVSRL